MQDEAKNAFFIYYCCVVLLGKIYIYMGTGQ